MNRRRFLRGLAAGGFSAWVTGCGSRIATRDPRIATGPAPRPALPPAVKPTEPARPHYVVMILLSGGYDSLLTFDPKRPEEVVEVDLEYRTDQLLKGKSRFYGPVFQPLMPHEADLALLHSVRVNTVGHEDATNYIARGRVSSHRSDTVMGDRIGALLPGTAPLHHMVVGRSLGYFLCGLGCYDDSLGTEATTALVSNRRAAELDQPDRKVPAYMSEIAELRSEDARALFGAQRQLDDYETTNRNAIGLGELFADGQKIDRFTPEILGQGLNIAIEAVRLNKARFITVMSRVTGLDSHLDNLKNQSTLTVAAFQEVATFLDLMKTTSNEHGPLIEQTTVVICTEMGRYSRLNKYAGRDHWPENTWAFTGRGIRREAGGLTVGATDERRRSRPIDFATGRLSDHGSLVDVDHAYATIVKAAGLDVTKVGYAETEVISRLIA